MKPLKEVEAAINRSMQSNEATDYLLGRCAALETFIKLLLKDGLTSNEVDILMKIKEWYDEKG